MKRILIISIFLACASMSHAQKIPVAEATLSLRYEIIGQGGYNGCTVTYSPDARMYFCAFAGNAEYPLEVFNTEGDFVKSGRTMVDMRGMWYNPKNHALEGTMFGGGAYQIRLENGVEPLDISYPENASSFTAPEDQSVAAANPMKGELFCYSYGTVYVYSMKNYRQKKAIALKDVPSDWEHMNSVSMIYTGYKNYEFGLWDHVNKQVHLFNAKGDYRQSILFPTDTPAAEMFRFGFANDRVWLFDPDLRTWYGYKAFH